MFTKEELEKMEADPRTPIPIKKRRPRKTFAGKAMAKLVANSTGFQVHSVELILAAYYQQILTELHNKNLVEIPGVGAVYPTLRQARAATRFNYHDKAKGAERMISQPAFLPSFKPSLVLENSLRKLPVSFEEIEELVYTKSPSK